MGLKRGGDHWYWTCKNWWTVGPFFFFFFFCDKTWQHFCWCCTSTEPTVSWFNSTSLYFQKSSSGLAGAAIKSSPNLHPAIEPRPNWMLSTSPKPSSQKICPQAAFGGNHHTFYIIDSTFSRRNEPTFNRRDKTKLQAGSASPQAWLHCPLLDSHGRIYDCVHCQSECNKKQPVWRSANKVLWLFCLKKPNHTCCWLNVLSLCMRIPTMKTKICPILKISYTLKKSLHHHSYFLKVCLCPKDFSLEACCTTYGEVTVASPPLLCPIIKTNGLSAYIR